MNFVSKNKNISCSFLRIKKPTLKVRLYSIKHRKNFNVAHTKFEYRNQSVSFCFLNCFTITSCTAPVLNYHCECVEVFKEFYMVRWTIPDLQSEDSQTFGFNCNLKMLSNTQVEFTFFFNKPAEHPNYRTMIKISSSFFKTKKVAKSN